MSNSWVLNASTAIPFSGSVGSSPYPYIYYGDQAATSQHGQAVAPEGLPARGLSSAPVSAPPQPVVAASWSQQPTAPYVRAWPNQEPAPVQHALISGNPDHAAGQNAPKQDLHSERIADLERDVQAARAQVEQQQQEGRILLAQVEGLTSELAAERQRSDELGRQLLAVSAAHQALQLEHERLTSQHAAIVREHEHMASSQAATLRELEAKHADISRLHRQLEEAQTALAAAEASGQQAGTAAQRGGPGRPGGQRATTPPPLRLGGHTGPHLAAANEDRWALRLHKAERALEEERRVSEELRQRLNAAEVESRAMYNKLHKLETELESPSGAAMPATISDPLPRSPRVLSPLSNPPPPLGTTSSGALTGTNSGQLTTPSLLARPALGRAASAGSGGAGAGVSGQAQAGVAKPGLPGSAFASSAAGGVSGGGGSGSGTPQEEQLSRLKREVDGLRSDLSRLAAAEEMHRVAARAAEDRARAAELVSLDVRRQCDQAARTIGRLIDDNSELVAKVNAQANALAECKSTAASKEAALRNLEAQLTQAKSQLAAAQAQVQAPPGPQGEPPQQHPHQPHHQLLNGPTPADAARGLVGGPAGSNVTHGSARGPPGREVLLPGGALTEADWKLVMLSEEVRRLVEEVSLSTTACLALQLKTQRGQPPSDHRQQQREVKHQAQPSLDLPRILSRLEGLAGRRLGPGETAAYIIELAGHMEALEQVLQEQKRRMAELAGEQQAESGAEPGIGSAAKEGVGAGPVPGEVRQDSEWLRQGGQQQQGQRQAGAQAEQHAGSDSTQGTESRGDERRSQGSAAAACAAESSEEAGSVSRVPAQQMASGSFADGNTSCSDSTGQQQPSLPPLGSPQSPATAPPPFSHHVIVSPFNHLAKRNDSQQEQEHQQGPTADSGMQGTSQDAPSLDFRNAQRPELAAAAAAAVAAATAAAAEADRSESPDAAAIKELAAGSLEGAVPVVLPQYEAPPSPRAAPGAAATAVGPPAPLVGVAVGVNVMGADALLDDDLLEEVAAGLKPRRPRVGLWGWISGEAVR